MYVKVLLLGPLKKYQPNVTESVADPLSLRAEPGWTVQDVIRTLGIPDESYSFVSIDGIKVSAGKTLKDRDCLKVFPPVSGG